MDQTRAHAVAPPVPGAPPDADETDALRCLAHVRTGEPVVVIGPARAEQWARDLGLTPTSRITPPTRSHARRAIARLRRTNDAHWLAWGSAAARLSGLPDATHETEDLASPPAAGEAPDLGLTAGEVAIAPVVGRPPTVDAQRVLHLLGALELMGRRVALVLPEGVARLDEARFFAASLRFATRIVIHRLPLAVAARSIDLGLVDSDAPPSEHLVRAVEAAGARTVRVDRGAHARPGLFDAARAVGPIDRAIAAIRGDAPDAATAHNPA